MEQKVKASKAEKKLSPQKKVGKTTNHDRSWLQTPGACYRFINLLMLVYWQGKSIVFLQLFYFITFFCCFFFFFPRFLCFFIIYFSIPSASRFHFNFPIYIFYFISFLLHIFLFVTQKGKTIEKNLGTSFTLDRPGVFISSSVFVFFLDFILFCNFVFSWLRNVCDIYCFNLENFVKSCVQICYIKSGGCQPARQEGRQQQQQQL